MRGCSSLQVYEEKNNIRIITKYISEIEIRYCAWNTEMKVAQVRKYENVSNGNVLLDIAKTMK